MKYILLLIIFSSTAKAISKGDYIQWQTIDLFWGGAISGTAEILTTNDKIAVVEYTTTDVRTGTKHTSRKNVGLNSLQTNEHFNKTTVENCEMWGKRVELVIGEKFINACEVESRRMTTWYSNEVPNLIPFIKENFHVYTGNFYSKFITDFRFGGEISPKR